MSTEDIGSYDDDDCEEEDISSRGKSIKSRGHGKIDVNKSFMTENVFPIESLTVSIDFIEPHSRKIPKKRRRNLPFISFSTKKSRTKYTSITCK